MKRLLWSHPARHDLFAIAEYYHDVDPDLAIMLLDRIAEAPLILLDYPGLGSPLDMGEVRKWRVTGTPFLLLYDSNEDGVRVIRVRHDVSDWTRR